MTPEIPTAGAGNGFDWVAVIPMRQSLTWISFQVKPQLQKILYGSTKRCEYKASCSFGRKAHSHPLKVIPRAVNFWLPAIHPMEPPIKVKSLTNPWKVTRQLSFTELAIVLTYLHFHFPWIFLFDDWPFSWQSPSSVKSMPVLQTNGFP